MSRSLRISHWRPALDVAVIRLTMRTMWHHWSPKSSKLAVPESPNMSIGLVRRPGMALPAYSGEGTPHVLPRSEPDPAPVIHEIGFCERHTGSPLRTKWARKGIKRRMGRKALPACPTSDSVVDLSAPPPSRASTA